MSSESTGVTPVAGRGWHLVVPVQDSRVAKSRLRPPSPLTRAALAQALAGDTLDAVRAGLPGATVVVVTDDPVARRTAALLGFGLRADPGGGLDRAVETGLRAATGAGRRVAVLLGDLPCLQGGDLALALTACGAHPRAFVPDAEGTGTVLLTATTGRLRPSFGPGSAGRHARDAQALPLALPRLRRDVDTWADLQAAAALGVGIRTRAELSRLQ